MTARQLSIWVVLESAACNKVTMSPALRLPKGRQTLPDTPISSFRVAREVHESGSTLNIYASEAVSGMTASLFNANSPYALQLGDEPVMREAVASLFTLINDYDLCQQAPSRKTSQIGNGGRR